MDKQALKFQTALRLKLENFLLRSWTLGTFNSLNLRLDWEGGGVTSLRARSLAAEFGGRGRVAWGGAVRELVRWLDPGR